MLGITAGTVGVVFCSFKILFDSGLTSKGFSTSTETSSAEKTVSHSDILPIPRGAAAQALGRQEPQSNRLSPLPAVLSPDQGSVLAEVVQLQQLAVDAPVVLTPEQWLAFGTVAAHFQTLRHRHEGSIASIGRLGTRGYTLEVPPYPETGAALRAAFESAVKAALGHDAANLTLRALSSALSSHFGGFGVSQQTLEFARNSGDDPTDYHVTRTVTFWQGTATDGRAVTRRETFFPALEDPTGQSWGALLQVLEKSISGG